MIDRLWAFLAEEIADFGIDPTREPGALHDALRSAILERGGEVAWEVEDDGWRVDLLLPVRKVSQAALEAALARCFLYPRAPEYGDACGERRR